MSVILNSRSIDVLENIFIFYDFNQVVDAVMVVAYIDKLGRWEKIFVYNSGDVWDIDNLAKYFDKRKFNWLSKKLNMIFQNRESSNQFDGIDIDKDMKVDSDFVVGLNQLE